MTVDVDAYNMVSDFERLDLTRNIWFLANITREEATRVLHNKEQGNFLVRGTKKHKREDGSILALSVKLGQGSVVEHFIILQRGGRLLLQDSDIQFDNIISLVFHYSNVCEELPEKLRLPEILRTTPTSQSLSSFALLREDFWNYPMSSPGRKSLLIPDKLTTDILSNRDQAENESAGIDVMVDSLSRLIKEQQDTNSSQRPATNQLSNTKTSTSGQTIKPACCVVTTPPKPPRKVSEADLTQRQRRLSSNHSPPSRQRRKSDPAPFPFNISAPTVSPRLHRYSVGRIDENQPQTLENACLTENWIISPVFKADRDMNNKSTRQRKESVFLDRLKVVHESINETNDDKKTADLTKLTGKISPEPCTHIPPSQFERTDKMYLNEDEWKTNCLSTKEIFEIGNQALNCETTDLNENICKDDPLYSEAADYRDPMDSLKENDNIYSDPMDAVGNIQSTVKHYNKNKPWKSDEDFSVRNLSARKHRNSDSDIRYSTNRLMDNVVNKPNSTRKLSLGVMLRKLSSRKISTEKCPREGKHNHVQEKRLSSVIAKLVGGGNPTPFFQGGFSFQTDSSSWEFLNKDMDERLNLTEDSGIQNFDHSERCEENQNLNATSLEDSVYETEYASGSSTMNSDRFVSPFIDQSTSSSYSSNNSV